MRLACGRSQLPAHGLTQLRLRQVLLLLRSLPLMRKYALLFTFANFQIGPSESNRRGSEITDRSLDPCLPP